MHSPKNQKGRRNADPADDKLPVKENDSKESTIPAKASKPRSEYEAAVDAFDDLISLPEVSGTGPIKGVPEPVEYSISTYLDPSRWTMVDPREEYARVVTLLRDPNRLATRKGERGFNLYLVTAPIALQLLETYPNLRRNLRKYDLRVANYRHTHEIVIYCIMHPVDGNEMSEAAYRKKLLCVADCQRDWHMVGPTPDGEIGTFPTELPNRDPVNFDKLYRGAPMKEILYKAFRDRVIDDWDHAVIREIRGV
ncbi:MAG: hypothetical protein WAU39_17580 [Polyangiales bacterium]